VFTPKYRRKNIYTKYMESIVQILKDLYKWKGVEIIEGKGAMMIFDRHANLKYKFGNRHFWSRRYYLSTVGLNEATIAKYVREQEKRSLFIFCICW